MWSAATLITRQVRIMNPEGGIRRYLLILIFIMYLCAWFLWSMPSENVAEQLCLSLVFAHSVIKKEPYSIYLPVKIYEDQFAGLSHEKVTERLSWFRIFNIKIILF